MNDDDWDEDLEDEEDEYVTCDECGNVFYWLDIVSVGLSDVCVECWEQIEEDDE